MTRMSVLTPRFQAASVTPVIVASCVEHYRMTVLRSPMSVILGHLKIPEGSASDTGNRPTLGTCHPERRSPCALDVDASSVGETFRLRGGDTAQQHPGSATPVAMACR